jgi:hypothetical protein
METNANDRMIDKIRKLLALSQSPNENEAARASEKVQELLAEYNLSMSDVAEKDADGVDESIVVEKGAVTASYPWRRPLAQAVASMYFCKYFYTTSRYTETIKNGVSKLSRQASDTHHFVGALHNIAVAKMMFAYLNETIDRLAREGALTVPPSQRSPYRTTFRGMCAHRVGVRIMKRIEDSKRDGIKTTSGTNLPALLNLYQSWEDRNKAHIEREVGKMVTRKSSIANLHSKGQIDGFNAGNNIGLDPQVGKSNTRAIGRS